MAGALAMMLGGAITNALAFSGSNYLFSHMGSDANDEKIRHDKAVENLQKETEEWNKRRIKRLKKESHAVQNYEDADQSMKEYYYATIPSKPKYGRSDERSERLHRERVPRDERAPQLNDFYTPSEEQKYREIAFVIGGMILSGFVAWKIEKM